MHCYFKLSHIWSSYLISRTSLRATYPWYPACILMAARSWRMALTCILARYWRYLVWILIAARSCSVIRTPKLYTSSHAASRWPFSMRWYCNSHPLMNSDNLFRLNFSDKYLFNWTIWSQQLFVTRRRVLARNSTIYIIIICQTTSYKNTLLVYQIYKVHQNCEPLWAH